MAAVKYKYPENVNVSDFVSVKLSGTNYLVWKSMMLSLIESHGLTDFITGYLQNVDDNDNENLEEMDFITGYRQNVDDNDDENLEEMDFFTGYRQNVDDNDDENLEEMAKIEGLLRRWILATVDQNILVSIVHLDTCADMWGLLARKFSVSKTNSRQRAAGINSGYLPLAKAALNNDWKEAAEFIDQDPNSIRADITGSLETALMIAVRSVRRIEFVRELVAIMSPEDVTLTDGFGSTALHMAADYGNIEAARLLLEKNPQLLYFFNDAGLLPLHEAAASGHREMVWYLQSLIYFLPQDTHVGGLLLILLISSGLYDLALSFVGVYPRYATSPYGPLEMLTKKCSAFLSGAKLNFWQRIIYSCVSIRSLHAQNRDIEYASAIFTFVTRKLYYLFCKVVERSVTLKNIRDMKLKHYQAQQLAKTLVREIVKLEIGEAVQLLKVPLTEAAAMGVYEIVEEILDMYPGAIYLPNMLQQSIFHVAVANRQENVFNLIYQVEERRQLLMLLSDVSLNNPLHLAGNLENRQKIKLRASAAGAALQMQRELQWFMAVAKLSGGFAERQINHDDKTAIEIFSETHQELVKEGEVWMKDTANSCAIVAALIVTVVFATAITLPGGNDSNTGLPFFAKHKPFIVFAISDVLALFSSTSSLLMFLSILTSRYSEDDFLYALPKRLIIGLTTLFLSIIFMMIAFTAAVDILFGDINSWVRGSVIALACVPVTLFMSLQFSLLVDMIKSTYGSGIFGKRSDRIIH